MDENLKQSIRQWASSIHFRIRIYFYGSRLKGTANHDSDFDLAIEFLDPWINRTLTWMDYHDEWESRLSKITNLRIHLELYDDENVHVRKYVKEKSIILFESPELPKTDDENFERDLAALLKKD